MLQGGSGSTDNIQKIFNVKIRQTDIGRPQPDDTDTQLCWRQRFTVRLRMAEKNKGNEETKLEKLKEKVCYNQWRKN